MLATHDLTIRFGGHVAVNAVTCSFEPGTLTAIVGPNGAGKSTLLNAIMGLLPQTGQTEGAVHYEGRDVVHDPVEQRLGDFYEPVSPFNTIERRLEDIENDLKRR